MDKTMVKVGTFGKVSWNRQLHDTLAGIAGREVGSCFDEDIWIRPIIERKNGTTRLEVLFRLNGTPLDPESLPDEEADYEGGRLTSLSRLGCETELKESESSIPPQLRTALLRLAQRENVDICCAYSSGANEATILIDHYPSSVLDPDALLERLAGMLADGMAD